MTAVEPTFTYLTVLNLLFWIVSIGCGLCAIFTDAWQGTGGFLKNMAPEKKRKLYRITGFVLVFTGVWMISRIVI